MKKIIIIIILLVIIVAGIAGYFLILNKKGSAVKISTDSSNSELENMDLDTFNLGTELSSDLFPEI